MPDYRDPETRRQEDHFICGLMNDKKVYLFANRILFGLIKKSKEIDFPIEGLTKILSSKIVNNIVEKPAYPSNFVNRVINITRFDDFLTFNRSNGITFSQVFGALYDFESNNVYWRLIMDNSTTLQTKFITTMRQYFSIPETLKYTELCAVIDKSYGNWFYIWVLTFIVNNDKNIFHRNLGNDSTYVRYSGAKNGNYNNHTINKKDSLNCKQTNLKNFQESSVLLGTYYYIPTENGVWTNLMKRYNKEIIAGPSGSAALLYQLIFDIAKIMPPTRKNKLMLMYCILADFYQFSHSISEILQEYSVDAKFKKYNLSMNDLEYIRKIK
jgi:hypothetical protein